MGGENIEGKNWDLGGKFETWKMEIGGKIEFWGKLRFEGKYQSFGGNNYKKCGRKYLAVLRGKNHEVLGEILKFGEKFSNFGKKFSKILGENFLKFLLKISNLGENPLKFWEIL